ncbi:MAG: transglycosylase SLT domain-containing protein [Bryobacteraceae bacterium]
MTSRNMAKSPKSADATLVKRLALAAALALLARAQSPGEAAAAAQRESVERQLQSLSTQAQQIRSFSAAPPVAVVLPPSSSATPPSSLEQQRASVQRQLAPDSTRPPSSRSQSSNPASAALPVADNAESISVPRPSSSLDLQRASIQRQLASMTSPHALSPPRYGNLPAATPDDPPSEPGGQASLVPPVGSFDLQIQSALLQPRLSWPAPPAPVPMLDCAPMPAAQLDPLFHQAASTYGIDPMLLRAVARRESAFKPCAVSPAGAMGLMQLMPETASMLGVEDPFDTAQSIFGGARFLRFLLDRFQNDLPLALAAYNAGPSAVDHYGGVPPYTETRDYVSSILRMLGLPSPPSATQPPAPENPRPGQ